MKFVVVLIALFALSLAQHCHECQQIVGLIESFANGNMNEDFVLGHVRHLCTMFPQAGYSAQCAAVIDAYGASIFKGIMTKQSPDKICTSLTMCPNPNDPTTVRINAVQSKTRDPTTCFLCTTIFQYAEGFISANASEEQVIQFLNTVICPQLGPFSPECIQLVQDYPDIIQYLIQQESPQVACGQLELCPMPKPKIVEHIQTGDPVSCSICTYIVAYLEEYISQNSTEAQLQQIISQQICPDLPSDFQEQCQTFAKELPQYIKQLQDNEPPLKACTDAGTCPAPSPRLRVIH